jgi:hypothetical protein
VAEIALLYQHGPDFFLEELLLLGISCDSRGRIREKQGCG